MSQSSSPLKTSSARDKCFIVEMYQYETMKTHKDAPVPITIDQSAEWMGIPEMLLFNFIMASITLLFFTWFRKKFYNYGRIACPIFTNPDPLKENNYDCFAHVGPLDSSVSYTPPEKFRTPVMEEEDKGWFTWFYLWAELTDEQILVKCGPSALQFLQFQNVVILLLSVVTQFCLIFILPLNKSGESWPTYQKYSMTTIANLEPDNPKLYVHCLIAVGFFIYGLYSLRWFSRALHVPSHWRHYKHGVPAASVPCTVSITDLPPTVKGNDALIKQFFEEAFPDCPISKINFAYNVKKLFDLMIQLRETEIALSACQKASAVEQKKMITVYYCRLFNCNCFKWMKRAPALEFYTNEVARLKKKRLSLIATAKENPLPICFVSFFKAQHADRIADDFLHMHRFFPVMGGRTIHQIKTTVDEVLRPKTWTLTVASKATDVAWERLNIKHTRWTRIALNVAVFTILFFLSTPSVFLNVWVTRLDEMGVSHHYGSKPPTQTTVGFTSNNNSYTSSSNTFTTSSNTVTSNSSADEAITPRPKKELNPLTVIILGQLIPSLIHLTTLSILPYVIEYGEDFSFHEYRSTKEMRLFVKSTIFMLFMLLIFPSFGLASGYAFLMKIFGKEQELNDLWKCLFLPEQSAFFFNFIIMSALYGNVSGLVRLGQIIYYLYRVGVTRSSFENEYARKMSIYQYPYAANYAHMITIFAIVMTYCTVSPLIAPCGFLYFCIRNQIDRYNLYFAYDAHSVPVELHHRAANVLVGCFIFSQVSLIGFIIMRTEAFSTINAHVNVQAIFLLTTFAISLTLFISQMYSNWFFLSADISPFQFCLGGSDSDPGTSGGGCDRPDGTMQTMSDTTIQIIAASEQKLKRERELESYVQSQEEDLFTAS